MQINVMNSRVIALLGQEPERWCLAGDQLYIDLDLSIENLPTGTRLAVGSAVIEGHTSTAHRVQEIPGALWAGGLGIRQFAHRQNPAFARPQCQGDSGRGDPDRGKGHENDEGRMTKDERNPKPEILQ